MSAKEDQKDSLEGKVEHVNSKEPTIGTPSIGFTLESPSLSLKIPNEFLPVGPVDDQLKTPVRADGEPDLNDFSISEDLVAAVTGKLSRSSQIFESLADFVEQPAPGFGVSEGAGDRNADGVSEVSLAPEDLKDPVPQGDAEVKSSSVISLLTNEENLTISTIPKVSPAVKSILEKVKSFSEESALPKVVASASFPFSLLIEGTLRDHEREKLLSLIADLEMGIREVDLEVQLTSNKILIPRISEYAGVILVQALRAASVNMQFGPSDEIYKLTEDSENQNEITSSTTKFQVTGPNLELRSRHPAEVLPISTNFQIPQIPEYEVLDVLTVTALLKANTMEAENSKEYLETLESLKRELIYRAYRKKADGIINFSVQIIPLLFPTEFRMLVMGSAVKAGQAKNLAK